MQTLELDSTQASAHPFPVACNIHLEFVAGGLLVDIVSCSASSRYNADFDCLKAFDGNFGTAWATSGEGSGSWIKAEFGKTVSVNGFEYQNRAANEANKDVTLSFSQGSAQMFTLTQSTLASYTLSPAQKTTFVTITINTDYTSLHQSTMVPLKLLSPQGNYAL